MELNIQVDPESINKLVAEAVLQSSIGVQVEKIVKAHVDVLGKSYDNPIDNVVKQHICSIIGDILAKDHADDIRRKLSAKVAEKLTDDFMDKLVTAALRGY